MKIGAFPVGDHAELREWVLPMFPVNFVTYVPGCTGAIRPPRATLAAQQRAFHRFRQEYNHERPHQFLGGRTPGSRYRPSTRPYTGVLPVLEYPDHFLVKRVTNAGTIRFQTRLLYLSTALKQHRIGLEEVDEGIWSVFFCDVLLGRIAERTALVKGQLGVTHVPG